MQDIVDVPELPELPADWPHDALVAHFRSFFREPVNSLFTRCPRKTI